MPVPRTPPAIETAGLRKSFAGQEVLKGVDLTVPAGTVFGLLGPNGAGKTTTVKILSTLIHPDAGEARVAGHDVVREPDAVRATIGVTGQFSAVDPLLTGEENLLLMASLRHLPRRTARSRVEELLSQFDLVPAAGRTAATYSGGMRRRLDLAMTLVARPSVVFLDEPTTGVDPRGRRMLWSIVREQVDGGATIFLTTQYLDEADHLADRIAVLAGGRIVAEGTPSELKRLVPGGHIRLQLPDVDTLAATARLFPEALPDDDDLSLRVPSGGDIPALRRVLDRLESAAIPARHLSVTTPDLDDVFLALTGATDPKDTLP